jgi:hypothetical protein
MCSSSGTHLGNFAQNRISLTWSSACAPILLTCERIYIAPMTNTYQRNLVYSGLRPTLYPYTTRSGQQDSQITSSRSLQTASAHLSTQRHLPISWVSYFPLGRQCTTLLVKQIVNICAFWYTFGVLWAQNGLIHCAKTSDSALSFG